MTDLEKAARQALGALERIDRADNDRDFLGPEECCDLDDAITALRQALDHIPDAGKMVEQPAQQEQGDSICQEDDGCPTEFAVLQRFWRGQPIPDEHHPAWFKPAQQEPVAWMDADGDVYRTEPKPNWCPPHIPLYTRPQARKWVGMTDEERNKLWREVIGWGDPSHDDEDLMKAIEAKLMEKNA